MARTGLQPHSLSDLINFIVPLDNRLYEREQERRRETKETGSRETKPVTSSGTTTVTASTRPSPNLGQYNRSPVNSGTRPVRLPTTATSRGPLPNEERQRRRDNNLCLYCGNDGHQALARMHRQLGRFHDTTRPPRRSKSRMARVLSAENAKAPST